MKGSMDQRHNNGHRESGGSPGKFFMAFYGGGLCSAVDFDMLMTTMMIMTPKRISKEPFNISSETPT